MPTQWQKLVESSLYEIGVLAHGVDADSATLNEALYRLRLMLDSWAVEGLLVPGTYKISHTVQTSARIFTLGIDNQDQTPDVALVSPYTDIKTINFKNRFETDSYPLERFDYDILSRRSTTNRTAPSGYYYEPSFPLAELRFDASLMPGDVFSIAGDTYLVPATIDGNSQLSVAREYEETVMLNLAVRLAPQHGASVRSDTYRETRQAAMRGKKELEKRNFQPIKVRFDDTLVLPGVRNWGYYYNTYARR